MSSEFDRRISLNTQLRPEIIHAAIQGFEAQKQQLDTQIAELRGMLNGSEPKAEVAPQSGTRRKVSAAARERMAAAQRKRWAAAKASEPVMTAATKAKRKLSAAGRAAIVAALKKRWALKRAAEQKPKPVAPRKDVPRKTAARKAT